MYEMVSLNITMEREGRIAYKACPRSYIADHMWTARPDKFKHLTSDQQLSNFLHQPLCYITLLPKQSYCHVDEEFLYLFIFLKMTDL
jgi:hypothetical protein